MARWHKPLARHDPAKVVLDVATSPALGGDACADTALLRAEPGLYGPVALDPTISRTIAALAADIHRVEQAVATARVRARAHVGASRASRVKPRGHGRETAGQRCGCDAGDGAQRQKERGADVQTGYGFHRCARSSITVPPADNADGHVREGADVAELTNLLHPKGYPPRMRVFVRRERPHPGAQLRFTDVDGYRPTAFVTNATRGQLADLELRHRRRARCEDRIRIAKDWGPTSLPLQAFAQNRLCLLIVQLANDLLAWMGLLVFADHRARRWEPKAPRPRHVEDDAPPGTTSRPSPHPNARIEPVTPAAPPLYPPTEPDERPGLGPSENNVASVASGRFQIGQISGTPVRNLLHPKWPLTGMGWPSFAASDTTATSGVR